MNANSPSQPDVRVQPHSILTLAAATVFCFAACVAAAEDSAGSSPADDSTREAPSPGHAGAGDETPLEPIVIEGDGPNAEPTHDQLMRKLGKALAQPPSSTLSERRLDGGVLEVTTRFGRFCARPMPAYLSSGIGGDIALLAPCATF
jgi:hypothetical protein